MPVPSTLYKTDAKASFNLSFCCHFPAFSENQRLTLAAYPTVFVCLTSCSGTAVFNEFIISHSRVCQFCLIIFCALKFFCVKHTRALLWASGAGCFFPAEVAAEWVESSSCWLNPRYIALDQNKCRKSLLLWVETMNLPLQVAFS